MPRSLLLVLAAALVVLAFACTDDADDEATRTTPTIGTAAGPPDSGAGDATASDGGDRETVIEGTAFVEDSITVAAGTTVEWQNRDTLPHTVTFDDGSLDSGLFRQDESFRHTFTTPGVFAYHCEIHPFMQAQVTVE